MLWPSSSPEEKPRVPAEDLPVVPGIKGTLRWALHCHGDVQLTSPSGRRRPEGNKVGQGTQMGECLRLGGRGKSCWKGPVA